MNKSSSATYLLYSDVLKGKVPRGQEKSGRGRRRSSEKGYQAVEDFRFITFIIFSFFFFQTLLYHFFLYSFYPLRLPTPTTHDI